MQIKIWLFVVLASVVGMAEAARISVRPTPFFPKPAPRGPLQQIATLSFHNEAEAAEFSARIVVAGHKPYTQALGRREKGNVSADIHIPDIEKPTEVTVELLDSNGAVVGLQTSKWQPQKKWTIYSMNYCHQDMGFGDYPHRLRTTIRHANTRLPIQYCQDTDDWPDDDKYRYSIETAEAVPSFIGFFGKGKARELAQRIREGRIQINGLHNTACMEHYGHELMARQLYLSGRHVPDLLNVERCRMVQQTDVIGLPWSFPTYAKEAGFDYFFHGYNVLASPTRDRSPFEKETFPPGTIPCFYFQGPDGSKIVSVAEVYSGERVVRHRKDYQISEAKIRQNLADIIDYYDGRWPGSILPSQAGHDFSLASMKIAETIHFWNSRYSYPRVINSTWSMYFDALQAEVDKGYEPMVYSVDMNNQWADQDAADAKNLGRARLASEALPATEKLATLAQMVSGGGGRWTDLYRAYHSLMQHHEHTNAKNYLGIRETSEVRVKQYVREYETELAEHRKDVDTAIRLQQRVLTDAQHRLSTAITRKGDKNLVVFNTLPRKRSDVVRCSSDMIPNGMHVKDVQTGQIVDAQRLSDETTIFVAKDIPATGYKTYVLENADEAEGVMEQASSILESDFYRMTVDRQNGAIASLLDKELNVELVEQDGPHRFNEYLYQRFDQPVIDTTFQYRDQPTHRMEQAAVSIHSGPVAHVVTVRGKAEAANEIRQTIVLYRHLKRIDFSMFVDKSPAGFCFEQGYEDKNRWPINLMRKEAVYAALPFNVPDFTLRHEVPGAVVEPIRQQLEGTSTAHYAIRSFANISNDRVWHHSITDRHALVCYGRPRPSPVFRPLQGECDFDRSREYPEKSRIYLYLMNNMFDVNIAWDQQGPVSFNWAMRSHAGEWKSGGADRFGRDVLQPLIAWRADGKNKGTWPETGSFLHVDQPNVMCSIVKPAEMNGRGIILRFNETSGRETMAVVSLPVMGSISSVTETSIVEDDRGPLPVKGEAAFAIRMKPFGVTTVRVVCEPKQELTALSVSAVAVADMQVDLRWKSNLGPEQISHYNIYRDTDNECRPELLNYIGQSQIGSYIDKPTLNYGGWIRKTLEPDTTYYYRVVAMDRLNNPGVAGDPIAVKTLKSRENNLPPVPIEMIRAIHVSPITEHNVVNVLFNTSCESDIAGYEIHRSTRTGFRPAAATKVGYIDHNQSIPGVIEGMRGYGHIRIAYPLNEFDHAMFLDETVSPGTTYHYRVCAVDKAGQKGEFSDEAAVSTEPGRQAR